MTNHHGHEDIRRNERRDRMPPQIKTLESHARAAGGAFAFREDDYDIRYVPPARPGRLALIALTVTGGAAALAHQFGWTSFLNQWRAI